MGVMMDRTLGEAVNTLFNGTIKATIGAAKGAGKVVMGVGAVSEKILEGTGNAVVGTIATTGAIGKGVKHVADTVQDGVEGLTGHRVPGFTKEIPYDKLEDQTIYGRLIGRELNTAGFAALTLGSMAISTGKAVSNDGLSKVQKLGYTSVSENLDRLVSYDGSGFVNRVNQVSNGNYEVMQDIVDNTFTDITQAGVSGDIVFALHNMREG